MRKWFLHIVAAFIGIILGLCIVSVSNAEMTEDGVEIIVFELVPTPTPEPPKPTPIPEIVEHEHDQEDVERIARLLWSSPLENEDYKRDLCWVVFNRIDDASGLFGDTVETAVTKTEFPFYSSHAHLSETNLRIVDEEMNAWKSGVRRIPKGYVYIRFHSNMNRKMDVMREIGGEAWVPAE